MRFKFEVEVELSFCEGKFESRETLAELIQEDLESFDGGEYDPGQGNYSIDSWEVTEVTIPKKKAKPKPVKVNTLTQDAVDLVTTNQRRINEEQSWRNAERAASDVLRGPR